MPCDVTSDRGECLLRWASLLVGCVATGLAFSSDAFSIYAQTLKEVFGYTQTQVEIIMSMAMLGLVSAWPASVLLNKCGPRRVSLIALFLTSGGCSLVCMAVHLHTMFTTWSSIIAVFFFIIGVGNGMMYISATTVNLVNFEGRWLGLVSGFMHSVKSVFLGCLLLVFDTLLANLKAKFGTSPTVAAQAGILLNFMIMLTGIYSVTNILAVAFYGNYKQSPETSDDEDDVTVSKGIDATLGLDSHSDSASMTSQTNDDVTCNKEGDPILPVKKHPTSSNPSYDSTVNGYQTKPVSSKDEEQGKKSDTISEKSSNEKSPDGWTTTLIRDPYFHALLWPCVFVMGFRNSFLNNISIVLYSVGIYQSRAIYILIPAVGVLSKPLVGLLADFLEKRIPRALTILICTVVLDILCLLDIGFIGNLHVINATMLMAQVTSSCVQTLGPPILIEYFGSDAFSAGWGMITVGFTLATVMLQLILGVFYDNMAGKGRSVCYGVPCFFLYFWINAVLIYLSCAALFFLTRKLWSLMKKTENKVC